MGAGAVTKLGRTTLMAMETQGGPPVYGAQSSMALFQLAGNLMPLDEHRLHEAVRLEPACGEADMGPRICLYLFLLTSAP